MAAISATLVKELRDKTGAGMMDCKRALEDTHGDLDAAVTLLREKGMASAAKRAGRETSEGKVGYRLADDGSRGTMVAVGCETEPVSNNEEFLAYAKDVLDAVDTRGAGAEAELEDARVQLSGKLGENIAVVGTARFERVDGGVIAAYAHPPANKIGVLVQLRGATPSSAARWRCTSPLAVHRSGSAGRRSGGDGRERARDLRELGRGSVETRAGA